MDYSAIIEALRAQAQALDRAIAHLEYLNAPDGAPPPKRRGRKSMSPEEGTAGFGADERLLGDADKPKMSELSHPLSAREKEVVILIASGLSCRKVASKLGITFNTTRAHRYNAMVKMKVNNVSSLLHAAIRLGLIEPPQP